MHLQLKVGNYSNKVCMKSKIYQSQSPPNQVFHMSFWQTGFGASKKRPKRYHLQCNINLIGKSEPLTLQYLKINIALDIYVLCM